MSNQGKFRPLLQKLRRQFTARVHTIEAERHFHPTETAEQRAQLKGLESELLDLFVMHARSHEYHIEMGDCPVCFVRTGARCKLDKELTFCKECGFTFVDP